MTAALAAAITKAASKQTYYTIRFLVDRPRVDDAYRAYAYFRWVDDAVDALTSTGWACAETERRTRSAFLDRQKSLLAACLRGEEPPAVDRHEAMLVELVRHAGASDPRLIAYLENMMSVMDFDVRRRGRLISRHELDDYTRRLAIAVTEAMHFFIGGEAAAPQDETRYLAVSGAHVIHMLRDTYPDVRAGYFNVPRELLEEWSIGPNDIRCDAYRHWVRERVRVARARLDAGKAYFTGVESRRLRLASLAYISRFEWLLHTLEADEFTVRPEYAQRRSATTAMWMARSVLSSLALPRRLGASRVSTATSRGGGP